MIENNLERLLAYGRALIWGDYSAELAKWERELAEHMASKPKEPRQ